ncbi:MAG: AraC family transcriptional regulator [Mucilaginibacter sp.]
MILSALPDPRLFENEPGNRQIRNTIVYASTDEKYYYPAHATPYLFATNFINAGQYIVNKQPVSISDKGFYFLNPGDELAINFKKKQQLKTLFILFNEDFVDNSLYSITAEAESQLDNPSIQHKGKSGIPNVPFQSGRLVSRLRRLLSANPGSQQEIDNALFSLLTDFAEINTTLQTKLLKLKAVKKSTREELYRRLFTARDFMEDNATAPSLSLDDIAAYACMNKFHFLTNFKALYGTTPYQYLTGLRLQKAFELLKERRYTVTQACYAVGFESVPSFSSLFKRKFALSPSSLSGENKLPNFQ